MIVVHIRFLRFTLWNTRTRGSPLCRSFIPYLLSPNIWITWLSEAGSRIFSNYLALGKWWVPQVLSLRTKSFYTESPTTKTSPSMREPLRNSCINPSSCTHLGGCSFDEHVDPQVLRKCWKPFCFCEQQVSPLHRQSWCWSLHLVDGEPWNKHTVRQIRDIINSYSSSVAPLGEPYGLQNPTTECFIWKSRTEVVIIQWERLNKVLAIKKNLMSSNDTFSIFISEEHLWFQTFSCCEESQGVNEFVYRFFPVGNEARSDWLDQTFMRTKNQLMCWSFHSNERNRVGTFKLSLTLKNSKHWGTRKSEQLLSWRAHRKTTAVTPRL